MGATLRRAPGAKMRAASHPSRFGLPKSGSTINVQLNNARRDSAAFNQYIRYRNWKFESTRPRATRIDEKNAVTPFD
jgi:hypothetical protein